MQHTKTRTIQEYNTTAKGTTQTKIIYLKFSLPKWTFTSFHNGYYSIL